jgi:hypothetical protein
MSTLIAKYIQFSYGAVFKSKEFPTCDLYLDPDPKKQYYVEFWIWPQLKVPRSSTHVQYRSK